MKNLNRLILLLILIVPIIQSCNEKPVEQNKVEDENTHAVQVSNIIEPKGQQGDLSQVETGAIQLKTISSAVECTGSLELPPKSRYSVYSPITGFVQFVKHIPGEYVRKGAHLTSIAHPDLIGLQRTFLEIQSQIEFLKSEYERKKILMEKEAGSVREFEKAKANYETEMVHLKGLKAELKLIGLSVEKLLDGGEINSQINLYAPSSGYLTKVNINNGKHITPNELLFEIIDKRHMHLALEVFASDLPKIQKGQRVEVSVPGISESFSAEVYLIDQLIEAEKTSITVHGHFTSKRAGLTPGMFVNAKIYQDEKLVPTIHESALLNEGGQQYVFLSTNNGFKKTQVETGIISGEFVELINWNFPDSIKVVNRNAYYVQQLDE